jgi:hypothetical protein
VNFGEPPQKLPWWHDNKINGSIGEPLKNEDPVICKRLRELGPVDGPPSAGSQLLLKSRLHVRCEEVLRELHLERDGPAIARISNQEVDSFVLRWHPNADSAKTPLNF